MPKFYITTAIDYSNGDPHLGHALEKIGADCIARYRRLAGDAVHFLMGMDEHSQSVIQAAAAAGVTPQAWVDRMASSFADYWRRLQCSNDDWVRTTEPRHARAVTALLERIRARHPDDLFEAEYAGLYCTGCEEFKTGAQIVDGHCIEHPTLTLIPTKERNHFFRLSGYRDAVLERIRSGVLAVEPEIRRNEVVRLLEAGLQDISISRQRQPWGIPFLRHFLLREVGFANDGDFTWERFDARYTAALANTLGNLVKRSLDMIHSYRAGTVPKGERGGGPLGPPGPPGPLDDAARVCSAAYRKAMDACRLEEGAVQWMELAGRANRYIQETAPWELKKAGKDAELDTVLASLARTVARLAVLAHPFVPTTSETIWGLFGPPAPLAQLRLAHLSDLDVGGRAVAKPPILVPKPRLAPA